MNKSCSLSVAQLLLAILMFSSLSVAYANDILKEIRIQDAGKEIEINTDLGIPISYVRHFPGSRGKIIQIQLQVDPEIAEKNKTRRRETITPESTGLLDIRDVIFEGNVRGGPYLVLRFNNVVKFSIDKVKNSQSIKISIEKEVKKTVKKEVSVPVVVEDKKILEVDQLMRDARIALTNGNNSEAIILFSKLLSMHEHKHVMDAKEYLGLARERNGQLELAKKEYEEYLKLYPKEQRANTVKQRLMTLNARLARPKKQLKESKRTLALRSRESMKRTDVFGRFSQIYYTAFIGKENTDLSNQQSLLLSFADASWRKRDVDKETRLVFSGSHEEDFKGDEGEERETRIRSLYGDYKNKHNGLQLTVGRQSVNSGGVLGRFDGAVVGFRFKPKFTGYLVGGFPVDFVEHQKLQSNKPMVGGRVDVDGLVPDWKASAYYIHQRIDGVTNRSAVGADARYFKGKKIFYSLVDYDISFQTMNFLTAHYGWQFDEKTKIDVHYDRRRSPVMLTSNALQGLSGIDDAKPNDLSSSVDSIELKNIKQNLTIQSMLDAGMPIEEIRQRAIDNTGYSTLITLSLRRTLMKDLEANANVTLNSYRPGDNLIDDEDEKPKDNSFLPSDFDVVFYGQIIQRNFFEPRDILIGGVRYSDNKTSTRYETNGTVRYPFKQKWWFDLKMRFMYTTIKAQGKNAARVNPKVRIEYRHNKKLTLEGEVGTEINKSQLPGEDYSWTSGNLGFRYLF